MSDGYVGYIVYNKPFSESDGIIRESDISIVESIETMGRQRSISTAKIKINTIYPENVNIKKINIYKNTISNEMALLQRNKGIPTLWEIVNTFSVNMPSNKYSSSVLSISGIPSHPKGYYHKFKIEFLDEKDEVIKIQRNNNKFVGDISNNIFQSPDIDFKTNSLIGQKIYFPSIGQEYTILSNIGTSVTLLEPISDTLNISGELSYSDSLVLLNIDGYGYKFNGINDLEEIANVEGLQIKSYNNNYDFIWQNNSGALSNNFATLRWKNMFSHDDSPNHLHIDGNTRMVTKTAWNNIESYVIFAKISDNQITPTENIAGDDTWDLIAEIPATHKDPSIQPYVEHTINNLPRGKYISFYVGAMTSTTETIKKIKGVE